MTIHLVRLLSSCSQASLRLRSQWGLASHVQRRYVQEFPGMRLDNSSPKDYVVVLAESMNESSQNELLRVPQAGDPEVDFSKLTPEVCFKGMSQAICNWEDYVADVNNQTVPLYQSVQELFLAVEKNLFPMDTAYNLLMIMLTLDGAKYNYPEIGQLLQRYINSREQKSDGQFKTLLQQMAFNKRSELEVYERRMLKFYSISTKKRQGVRPEDENFIVAHRKNLATDLKQFLFNVNQANKQFSNTVDDPDILAAVADEFDDCHDLHHKERTPIEVNSSTYHRFMRVCPDRFVRQLLWQTYNKRCSPKGPPRYNNVAILNNIKLLRRKLADMSGYRSHLEMKLEGTMASSRQRVMDSLTAINNENSDKLSERLRELTDYAIDNSFSDAARLGLREYDIDFWSNKYMHDVLIGVSEPKLKLFFPFKSVMRGLQSYFATYFSIEFKTQSRAKDQFWSSDVQFIEVTRKGQPIGTIIYSPYQRGVGRSDVYYARLRSRVQGASHMPARFMSTPFNLDASTGQANLSVPEVMTLFVCFSTVIQRLMYNYPYYELNTHGGIEPDVIRLLPKLCEAHLLSDHKILQSCSTRDGSKPIDSELASRIVKAHSYSRPFKTWFELYKAHLDLDVHATMRATKNLIEETYAIYSPFPREPDNYDYCAMSEIFVGPNDGLLYSDLWSKQLANFCMGQLQTDSGKLDDQKTKDLFNGLLDTMFTADNLSTEIKLTALTGQSFEPTKLGLGVL